MTLGPKETTMNRSRGATVVQKQEPGFLGPPYLRQSPFPRWKQSPALLSLFRRKIGGTKDLVKIRNDRQSGCSFVSFSERAAFYVKNQGKSRIVMLAMMDNGGTDTGWTPSCPQGRIKLPANSRLLERVCQTRESVGGEGGGVQSLL